MPLHLQRIILFGKEIGLLKGFYQQFFGATVIEEIPGEWIVLNTGQMELALHKAGAAWLDGDKPFRAESNTKIVFNVTEDLHQLREKWAAAGVNIREVISFPGFPALFCDGEDPEGNVFQLMQQPA